jgi:hypothetical protein
VDIPILRLDRHTLPKPQTAPAQVAPRIALEITRGRVQQRLRPVAGKVSLIGSASDCDLVLGDLQFPEAYAYVFVSGSQVSVRRLGSGPELLVCGEPVETAELFHGDLVELGPFELRVLIEDPPRGGTHSDHDDLADGPCETSETEQAGAIHEVRLLLADIRRTLADDSPAIRLYHDPSEYEDRSARSERIPA